jgi:hypothetical protein
MPVGTCHDWPTRPETPASILEQPGKVASSRADDVHISQWILVVLGELCARAIPWFKQILKVFVCGLAGHNDPFLKALCEKYGNQCQIIA